MDDDKQEIPEPLPLVRTYTSAQPNAVISEDDEDLDIVARNDLIDLLETGNSYDEDDLDAEGVVTYEADGTANRSDVSLGNIVSGSRQRALPKHYKPVEQPEDDFSSSEYDSECCSSEDVSTDSECSSEDVSTDSECSSNCEPGP